MILGDLIGVVNVMEVVHIAEEIDFLEIIPEC